MHTNTDWTYRIVGPGVADKKPLCENPFCFADRTAWVSKAWDPKVNRSFLLILVFHLTSRTIQTIQYNQIHMSIAID